MSSENQPGFWEKLEILSRPISALLTALAVAALGYWGNLTITNINNQQELTKQKIAAEQREAEQQLAAERRQAEFNLSKQQQDTHLYTELMANREESESNLRKDMFTTILKDFFGSSQNQQALSHKAIEDRLLKLELLAQNFSESLSLHPLFAQLNRDIDKSENYADVDGEDQQEDLADDYKSRLRSLARLVASRQIATIQSNENDVRTLYLSIDDIRKRGNQFHWPNDVYDPNGDSLAQNRQEEILAQIANEQCLSLGRSYTKVNMIFSRLHEIDRTVDVEMTIETQRLRPDVIHSKDALCVPNAIPPEDFLPDGGRNRSIKFNLDFFNFPLIDNTLLDGDNRLAVVLTNFKPKNNNEHPAGLVEVKLLLFPSRYAARRDKPSLYQAIEQLRVDTDLQPGISSSPLPFRFGINPQGEKE